MTNWDRIKEFAEKFGIILLLACVLLTLVGGVASLIWCRQYVFAVTTLATCVLSWPEVKWLIHKLTGK